MGLGLDKILKNDKTANKCDFKHDVVSDNSCPSAILNRVTNAECDMGG